MRTRDHLLWALRRAISTLPVLLLVATTTFFIVDALPGNAAQQLLGASATPADVEALKAEMGLDRPGLVRYGEWLLSVARGDMGRSMAGKQPVRELIAERLHITLELVGLSLVIALAAAIPCAIMAAYRPSGVADSILLAVSMASLSAPSYVLSIVLVLIFAVSIKILPSMGYVSWTTDPWRHIKALILPCVALAIPLCGMYLRLLRGELLQRLTSSAYVLTAVAKGLSPLRVIIRHCMRPALPGLVTIVSLNFAVLISSTVVIEQVFAIPGLGSLLLQAVTIRDYPVVQGLVLTLSTLTVAATIVGEILVTLLDPRSTLHT